MEGRQAVHFVPGGPSRPPPAPVCLSNYPFMITFFYLYTAALRRCYFSICYDFIVILLANL